MQEFEMMKIAEYLMKGEKEKKALKKVTSVYKTDLTIEEAYQIQKVIISTKLANGHKMIGPKMGLTNKAKMEQMGVNEPIYGYVFDYMLIENGGFVSMSELIHPKVEAEIAFVIGEDIVGPGVTGAQVLASTRAVLPALEIIDSRYENFNFTLPDVIADNASTSRVVFGTKLTDPNLVDLELVGATLSINGEIKELGAGAAVLGHPANAIAMLANMLSRRGEKIRKGNIILSGALTSATQLEKGDVVLGQFDQIGDVSFKVIE